MDVVELVGDVPNNTHWLMQQPIIHPSIGLRKALPLFVPPSLSPR